MANGGDKLYIFRDGFGDRYSATPEEEREWTCELIAASLSVLSGSDETANFELAIETLMYHLHPGVDILLLNKVLLSAPLKTIAIASALWRFFEIRDSFAMIERVYMNDPVHTTEAVFRSLRWFGNHPLARPFLISARDSNNDSTSARAAATLASWPVYDLPSMIYRRRMNSRP